MGRFCKPRKTVTDKAKGAKRVRRKPNSGRNLRGIKARQFRHFHRCRILYAQSKNDVDHQDYSLGYLVTYCNQRWGQWTSDTTDELCRVIQQHSAHPIEANRVKLLHIEQFAGQMYTVS